MTEQLQGGNSGVVIRDGDVVRKPSGPWTPQVHALLHALRARGVAWVPEPFGLDDEGREVLEYIEGDVAIYPMPDWIWGDAVLVDAVRLTRQLHDASVDLGLPRTGWRRLAVEPVEVMTHFDLAPYNAVCRDGQLIAFIDWDYATPGPRLWDLGYLAYRWLPMGPPDGEDGHGFALDEQRRRMRLLCDTYGGVTPQEVLGFAVRRLDDLIDYSLEQVAVGNPTFLATHAEGHTAFYQRQVAWIREHWRP